MVLPGGPLISCRQLRNIVYTVDALTAYKISHTYVLYYTCAGYADPSGHENPAHTQFETGVLGRILLHTYSHQIGKSFHFDVVCECVHSVGGALVMNCNFGVRHGRCMRITGERWSFPALSQQQGFGSLFGEATDTKARTLDTHAARQSGPGIHYETCMRVSFCIVLKVGWTFQSAEVCGRDARREVAGVKNVLRVLIRLRFMNV